MSSSSTTKVSRRIPDADLLQELNRLAEELDRPPKIKDLEEQGKYSDSTYRRRFGNWKSAVEAAGMEPHRQEGYTIDELKTEMRRLADDVGHPPTKKEMLEEGKFSPHIYVTEFGGWLEAREEVGLSGDIICPTRRIDREELLDGIQELANELGRTPAARHMASRGAYSMFSYQMEFGSWNDALEAAGFSPNFERGTRQTIECDWCGGEIERTTYELESRDHHFCSRSCFGEWQSEHRTGDDATNWKGGVDPYYGPTWYKQRERALERDNYQCQDCGITAEKNREQAGEGLHIHHITPIRKFDSTEDANQLVNLITLCRDCHNKWEGMPVAPDTESRREAK